MILWSIVDMKKKRRKAQMVGDRADFYREVLWIQWLSCLFSECRVFLLGSARLRWGWLVNVHGDENSLFLQKGRFLLGNLLLLVPLINVVILYFWRSLAVHCFHSPVAVSQDEAFVLPLRYRTWSNHFLALCFSTSECLGVGYLTANNFTRRLNILVSTVK
jgi:hypothetical protein